MTESGTGGCVRLRPTWTSRVAAVLPMAVILGVAMVAGGMTPTWVGFFVAVLVTSDLLTRHNGITLAPDVAVVHCPFRRARRIPWSRIQAVTVEANFGSSRILLWTDERRPVPLGAPTAMFRRRDFTAGFHLVGRWWLQHRGPAWRPLWPATPTTPPPVPPGYDPWAPPTS